VTRAVGAGTVSGWSRDRQRGWSLRAILMAAVGGPEVLRPAEVAELEFGRRDVRVELRAAGVNPVDAKLRANGTIAGEPPAILGWDGAGVVSDVGAEVTRFQPGDEVWFCDGGFGSTAGTYAEAKALGRTEYLLKPARADVPIYVAALRPKAIESIGELADGWIPTVLSNCFFVAPHWIATAKPWMISGASAPIIWQPTTRLLARSTTSFIIVRSSRPESVCLSPRKLVTYTSTAS